jgi:hypothetical protein
VGWECSYKQIAPKSLVIPELCADAEPHGLDNKHDGVGIMQSRAAYRAVGGLVCIAATAGVAAATPEIAAPPAGPALAPRTHGFMLYLSQPVGGGAGASLHPKFGFRIEQVRMMGNSGAPDAGDPLQHRALIGWQMDGLRGMHPSGGKVELGGRMTYDVTHGVFAAQLPKSSNTAASRQSTIAHTEAATESKPFSPHLFEPGNGLRDPFRQSVESESMVHDIAAAAIGSFKLARPVATQQRVGMGERPASMRGPN